MRTDAPEATDGRIRPGRLRRVPGAAEALRALADQPRISRILPHGPGQKAQLHGKESLVSMLGVSNFGHITTHKAYLGRLQAVSDDPAADTLEYIRRDLPNMATGNPHSHGRNTALTKPAGGGIRLSPLFDYAPMRLSDAAVMRVTTWECMKGAPRGTGYEPICQAVACDGLDAGQIREAMLSMTPLLERLDELARDLIVPEPVIAQAFDKGRVAQEILGYGPGIPVPKVTPLSQEEKLARREAVRNRTAAGDLRFPGAIRDIRKSLGRVRVEVRPFPHPGHRLGERQGRPEAGDLAEDRPGFRVHGGLRDEECWR